MTFKSALAYGAMAILSMGAAQASTVSITSGFGSTLTEITDKIIAMTPFIPGTNGIDFAGHQWNIDAEAVLNSFTISYNQRIAGTITIQNDSVGTQNVSGTVSTLGVLYLFTPTPVGDLTGGVVLPAPFQPTDDIFAGLGPSSTKTVAKAGLAGGGTQFGPVSYNGNPAGPNYAPTANASATTGALTSGTLATGTTYTLNTVKSAWNVYADSATITTTSVSGSGTGQTFYTANVSGLVTVSYDYTVPIPEPATMGLMGSALLAVGLWRKKLSRG